MTRQINVVSLCKNSLVFRADGELLRNAIERLWSDEEPVVVDFENVRIASVSFLDEAIGVLALSHPIPVIQRRLHVRHMREEDRQLLSGILTSRSKEGGHGESTGVKRVKRTRRYRTDTTELNHVLAILDELLLARQELARGRRAGRNLSRRVATILEAVALLTLPSAKRSQAYVEEISIQPEVGWSIQYVERMIDHFEDIVRELQSRRAER